MQSRGLKLATAATVLLGLAVAGAWVAATGGLEAFAVFARADPLFVLLLLALTALFVLARFVRWQYLLRRAGVSVPARPSFAIYLASLPGTATPAYVGEAVRCLFLRRAFGSPVRRTLLCLVIERALDVAVLALLGLAVAETWWVRGALALLLAGAWIASIAARRGAARLGVPQGVIGTLGSGAVGATGLALSLAVWAPVTLGLWVSANALGYDLAPLESVRAFTQATLLGALSLMPAGFGVAGSAQIGHLMRVSFEPEAAVATVTLLRILTVGTCLFVGSPVLFFVWRWSRAGRAVEHFDEIAGEYGAQFRPHVWRLLLERRVARIEAALSDGQRSRAVGLDLGCGLGEQRRALARRGWRVVGVDPSQRLLARGALPGEPLAAGSALALPFADGSLDFAYAVGVLHHLLDRASQEAACREVARVLAPGGTLVVQDTNTHNPLFRFYMGYVFPFLSRIDEGTELWIEPERWSSAAGLTLERLEYFTFLPDFVPERLLPPLLALERRLERGPLRRYSVHYQAVLRKAAAEVSPADRAARSAPASG